MTPSFHLFRGSGPLSASHLTRNGDDPLRDPAGYIASKELAQAVNVALAIGRPLLVTGEPGTGKTELAYRIAAEISDGEVLRFDTKSSSQAVDLFYQFDSVGQFAQVQLDVARKLEPSPAIQFLRIQAFGKAILRTLPPETVRRTFGLDEGSAEPRRSVVLVDELDKAPRDFPNDLLNQIANLEFSIPEIRCDTPVKANREFAPFVLITSNSEKQLPDAFLRRCVYHHIEFPRDRAQLARILGGRLGGLSLNGPVLEPLMDWFLEAREKLSLEKRPSTSELLDWMRALGRAGLGSESNLKDAPSKELVRQTLGCLFKTQRDLESGSGHWERR
ncbi:MAG: MoxR family ATPase [Verrucomicrobiales bacterium]|nr:MoxR family ATPase [Verrucomicrobiales bacterium]